MKQINFNPFSANYQIFEQAFEAANLSIQNQNGSRESLWQNEIPQTVSPAMLHRLLSLSIFTVTAKYSFPSRKFPPSSRHRRIYILFVCCSFRVYIFAWITHYGGMYWQYFPLCYSVISMRFENIIHLTAYSMRTATRWGICLFWPGEVLHIYHLGWSNTRNFAVKETFGR